MRLRDIRKAKGLSAYRVSKLLGVAEHQMSAWELGKTRPSLESAIKLADFYGVSLDELVGREPQAAPDDKPAA